MTQAVATFGGAQRAALEPLSEPRRTLLRISDLSVDYVTRGRQSAAVRGVSFEVRQGEVVALVGESGSGKSTIALAATGMLPDSARVVGGSITLGGRELVGLRERALSRIRGDEIGWIPQDPMIALNPLHRVGRQVAEPLRIHRLLDRQALQDKVISLLERVRIPDAKMRARQFPHELSGGMRQRVLIAAAVGPEPRLIIADEPTTALDVTVQKTILDDIAVLTASSGISMLLITHDLGVAIDRANRVVVLKEGQIVEEGSTEDVMRRPRHAYTRMLLASAPSLANGRRRASTISNFAVPATSGSSSERPSEPILSIRNISRDFMSSKSRSAGTHVVRAVVDVSLELARGKTLAIVGESGSGKSTTARIALGLIRPDAGDVFFDGVNTKSLDREGVLRMRRLTQPIYQNPFSSLDPRFSVLQIIDEPLEGFRFGDRAARRRRVRDLMEQVGLSESLASRYPAELSGGQRQRVAIARALAPEPAVLVCDEPVSALDVSIQAQILELLAKLQEAHGLSYLFISHDLAVVRQVADDVAVMKDGRVVEVGPADEIFVRPRHEYTRLLLDSIPGGGRLTHA